MTISTALREVNNAVLDLQSADYNTFERPLERLASALNSNELRDLASELKTQVDFDEFVEAANEGGSMMGSARLNWPSSRTEELGLVIHLIERAAREPRWFLGLAHRYYYSGRKIVGDLRKITTSVIVPFNRDFAAYIEEHVSSLPTGLNDVETDVAEDKEELLQALFEYGEAKSQRPSVQSVAMKFFPDWSRDRLFCAAQALEEDGDILNLTGAMLYVDLSSTARKRAKAQAAKGGGGVTYNIGSMQNSPLQHNSSQASGTQNVNYSSADLAEIIRIYRDNVDSLELDEGNRNHADAQIATIEAQLQDEPNPTIIRAAGHSLKNIVEGALGGAAGAALAAAPAWGPLLAVF